MDVQWDVIAISAMDNDQKAAFEKQLRLSLASRFAMSVRVYGDEPDGVKIGMWLWASVLVLDPLPHPQMDLLTSSHSVQAAAALLYRSSIVFTPNSAKVSSDFESFLSTPAATVNVNQMRAFWASFSSRSRSKPPTITVDHPPYSR